MGNKLYNNKPLSFRINGFELIKAFYSWVFNNPDKVRPTHISLYLFLLNQANRANWVEWFKCPYDLAMQGACIGNNNTYYRCLDNLQDWGLIQYKKGINNYKAPMVKLNCLYENERLSEQVSVPLSEQLIEHQYVQLPGQLPAHRYKLLTENINLITDNLEEILIFLHREDATIQIDEFKQQFELFRNSYPGTKRSYEIEFSNLKKKHKDWKEIVPKLCNALDIQKAARDTIANAAGFVAPWKNLQTYINQRAWEEEYNIIPVKTNSSNGMDEIYRQRRELIAKDNEQNT